MMSDISADVKLVLSCRLFNATPDMSHPSPSCAHLNFEDSRQGDLHQVVRSLEDMVTWSSSLTSRCGFLCVLLFFFVLFFAKSWKCVLCCKELKVAESCRKLHCTKATKSTAETSRGMRKLWWPGLHLWTQGVETVTIMEINIQKE